MAASLKAFLFSKSGGTQHSHSFDSVLRVVSETTADASVTPLCVKQWGSFPETGSSAMTVVVSTWITLYK